MSGPAEVFHLADSLGEFYDLCFLSVGGGAVRSSAGIVIADTVAASGAGPLGTLLIAGGEKLVARPLDGALLDAVGALAAQAGRVASACTGAFVLGELGYLDGRCATTHWRHAAELARRHRNITVEADVIHIHDGPFITSAGITAGIDLALALVEQDLGAETARRVAQELVVFMQRPGGQTQFSAALHRPLPDHAALHGVMEAVIADPADEWTVTSMAGRAGMSPRHLSRLFHAELGVSPARWLEQIRVDMARALLLDGHSVTRVAQLCGLGSDERLRRLFARHLGTTPTAFRERFSTTQSGL